jgi:Ca2+-binding EF-hand superfamily protein
MYNEESGFKTISQRDDGVQQVRCSLPAAAGFNGPFLLKLSGRAGGRIQCTRVTICMLFETVDETDTCRDLASMQSSRVVQDVDVAMYRASADAAAVRKLIFQRVASVHVANLKRWDLDSEPHRPQVDSSTGRFAEFQDETHARALDMEEHDTDNDNKLDFSEFCSLVRSREEGNPTDAELRARFNELDADGSGKVDMNEYIRFTLHEALCRSSVRVIDLFRRWDEDGSGSIDRFEFRRAIRALGFDYMSDDSAIDAIFDEFDKDRSGSLDYKELAHHLARFEKGGMDKGAMNPGVANRRFALRTVRKRVLR